MPWLNCNTVSPTLRSSDLSYALSKVSSCLFFISSVNLLLICQGTSYMPNRLCSIKFLPANKGNKVVVLDRDTYISKVKEILDDTNDYEPLRKNPIKEEQTYYNSVLKKIYECMHGKDSTPKRFKSCLAKLAYLYLLPKIHKKPFSFRPIVSQDRTFTTPKAKHLADILSPLLGTYSIAHKHNSVQLKSLLQ
ncbi:unnamed protein product, partial [Meganyctiphanes norvegica]